MIMWKTNVRKSIYSVIFMVQTVWTCHPQFYDANILNYVWNTKKGNKNESDFDKCKSSFVTDHFIVLL